MILLVKLRMPNFKYFLSDYCIIYIPDESTLQKENFDSLYTRTMD